MTARQVLVGLDGADFRILRPLMESGDMPVLSSLIDGGVSAELRTVVPALTPPAWTSLATGRSPGFHGILDFFRKESPDSPHLSMLSSRDVACPTIWDIFGRDGRSVTVLNFPMTFPPPQVDGHVVAGWLPWRQLRMGCRPASLYERIKRLPGLDTRRLAMDMKLEEKAIEGCDPEEYEAWIDFHVRRERQWVQILALLAESEPSDLTAILFDGVDKLQHLLWRFIDADYASDDLSEWEVRIRERCVRYYRELDGILAHILDLTGPDANVVIASDHGFGPQTTTFFVNAWLEARGDLAWKVDPTLEAEHRILGLSEIGRHSLDLDWDRTRAYAPMPSSNGIHIVKASEEHPHGVPDSEYHGYREALIEDLYEVRRPDSAEPLVSKVWTREEVFEGPFVELAPDLTLVLHDGGLVSILGSSEPVKARNEVRGTHRPEGVFVAHGPDIRSGVELPELSILDVAPMIVHLMGEDVPAEMEGRVPVEALTEEALSIRPARVARASDSSARATPEEYELDEEAEEAILTRLRNLGYVE